MSAFLCSDRHISAVVNAARLLRSAYRPRITSYLPASSQHEAAMHGAPVPDEYEALFNVLLEENLASVADRYPTHGKVGDWRTTDAPTYDREVRPESFVAALKLIDSYTYQSCEHDGWKDSKACEYVTALAHALVSALPGYDEAPWSI